MQNALPILTLGSRATGPGPFHYKRGEQRRSGAARANCLSRNGSQPGLATAETDTRSSLKSKSCTLRTIVAHAWRDCRNVSISTQRFPARPKGGRLRDLTARSFDSVFSLCAKRSYHCVSFKNSGNFCIFVTGVVQRI